MPSLRPSGPLGAALSSARLPRERRREGPRAWRCPYGSPWPNGNSIFELDMYSFVFFEFIDVHIFDYSMRSPVILAVLGYDRFYIPPFGGCSKHGG